ncbi:hypothetical protein WCP94_004352 [Bilophila wadsworthia]
MLYLFGRVCPCYMLLFKYFSILLPSSCDGFTYNFAICDPSDTAKT